MKKISELFKKKDKVKKPEIDITNLSEDEIVAYYGLLFSAAAQDGNMSTEELTEIFNLVTSANLDENLQKRIYQFVINPPDFNECLSKLNKQNSDLRFYIVFAVAEVILADDKITPEEQQMLDQVCEELGVTEVQKQAIVDTVRKIRKGIAEGYSQKALEEVIKNATSALAAVGVPLTSLYFSGTVGFSAIGITTGLATLGLGMGMLSGIGVSILMGTTVYIGMRKVIDKTNLLGKSKEILKKEEKIQLALRNMQKALNLVIKQNSELNKTAEDLKRQLDNIQQRIVSLYKKVEQKSKKGNAKQ